MDGTSPDAGLQGNVVARPYPAGEHTDRIKVRRGRVAHFFRRTQGTLFFCVSSGLALFFLTMVLKIILHA
jgi:hypothetical protein